MLYGKCKISIHYKYRMNINIDINIKKTQLHKYININN